MNIVQEFNEDTKIEEKEEQHYVKSNHWQNTMLI